MAAMNSAERKQIRVLLVDDHRIVREGLRRMLSMEEDISVVGEAKDMKEAMRLMKNEAPDVVLMDIKMPDVDGIEATRRLMAKFANCKIIMLTLYEEYVSEALQAGAAGYLLKDVKRAELSHAIRMVHRGQYPPVASLVRKATASYNNSPQGAGEGGAELTDRQVGIVKLLASGATYTEVASELRLADDTVRQELQDLYGKLGVNNRSRAIAEALRRRII